ncbi:MAG: IS21 family transposase [Candidatus Competibacteraceae bacterium]|nr:IS21 family transposase [Candidatus Competibacteraceae bacterium]
MRDGAKCSTVHLQERARWPTTGPWHEQVAEIIEEDKKAPRKQRHTAKRIFERLKERGYEGSERSIRQIVATLKNKPSSDAFVPLLFAPGKDAQVDFGESYADIGGQRVKLHGFEMRLNFSRKKFVMFFPSTDKEAFLEGHVRAFQYFQGVVDRISYDNLSAAVAHIGKGKDRSLTSEFKQLKGFYNFKTNFCTPGEDGAHEKGGVENGVGFARRNWMVPVPKFDSIDELNADILSKCQADDKRTVEGQQQTIAQAFAEEHTHLLVLPARPFDPAVQQQGSVDSYCTVQLKNNHYSVPPQYVGKILTIRSYWNRVEITTGLEKIAEHPRSYGKMNTSCAPSITWTCWRDGPMPCHMLDLCCSMNGRQVTGPSTRRWLIISVQARLVVISSPSCAATPNMVQTSFARP